MECESTIKFDIKSLELAESFVTAFKAFEGINPRRWDDASQRKEKFSEGIKPFGDLITAEDIYSKFIELDTGVTDVSNEGSEVTLEIFPWDFPEDLCKYLFPILEKKGGVNISCDSDSEYGHQLLNYVNGQISRKEKPFEC